MFVIENFGLNLQVNFCYIGFGIWILGNLNLFEEN
jgi:hypothetical protein